MLNVIRMELYRMVKTRSFYVTLGVGIAVTILLMSALAPSLNQAFDTQQMTEASTAELSDGSSLYLYMEMDGGNIACPANICGQFISMGSLFTVIFIACFVSSFYKNGFCKNIIGSLRNRYTLQISRAVCAAAYTAVLLLTLTVTSIIGAKAMIHSFTFSHMGAFLGFLLGEYCLLTALGLFAAFVTDLSYSKIPAIVYIFMLSTSLLSFFLAGADNKLSKWFSGDVRVENWFPSLYQIDFMPGAPWTGEAGKALLHAVVLSVIFVVIYNAAGAALFSKRDVK